METKIIYNQSLAGWLMMKGFKLERTNPNRQHPHFNVFIFNKSDALESRIQEYLTTHK